MSGIRMLYGCRIGTGDAPREGDRVSVDWAGYTAGEPSSNLPMLKLVRWEGDPPICLRKDNPHTCTCT